MEKKFDKKKKLSKEIEKLQENPSLDEVWDLCVRYFLYDPEKYISEIETLFKKMGISKNSRIADLSAGGGFPALNLLQEGYNVDSYDAFSADIFNRNALASKIDARCKIALWQELPEKAPKEPYDFIFCRGNSFIFAGGNWKGGEKVDKKKAMADYLATMKIFAGLLKEGGYLYIDKFKDSELGHREKLGTINVGGQKQDLLFWSQRFPEKKRREVFMERVVDDKIVDREKRVTYDLSENELIEIMESAGFSGIKKISVKEEKHFDIWLAKKATH